ncbi:MAG TPA: cytochrome c-type biogenesis protein [Levilinea sp.]|nr:cytochrome c-type biogenesis protein [Levilinea sp.]
MKFSFFPSQKTHLNRVLSALIMALLAGMVFTGLALAQNPTPVPVTDDDVNRVSKELYCPVCENVPLDMCGTQACIQWRQVVREKLEAGYSEQEVRQYFADYYGDQALSAPPPRGLNLLVYILPPVFFLGGAIVLYRSLRKMHRPEKPVIEQPLPKNDPYLAKFEEQLKRMEKEE